MIRDRLPSRARSACSLISSIVRRFRSLGAIDQLLPFVVLRIAGEKVEQRRNVVGHHLVGGEQAEVGVHQRRVRIVVAGAQVHVAADLLAFLAHDHRQLAVRLETHEAEHHVHAGPLQVPRPGDVVGLVEPRLELHERRHVLAVLGRLGQRAHDRAVAAARAIERLLDGQHLRIAGRQLDEIEHRHERLVRMVQQNVVLGNFGE